MASFNVVIDTSVLEEKLTALEREQLPYARMLAANEAAYGTMLTMRRSLPLFFDKPTPWTTKRVLLYGKATKERPAASIYIPAFPDKGTPPTDVFAHHILGTKRVSKRSERHLQRAGLIAENEIVVPGKGLQLDAYGNIPGRVMVQILSGIRAFTESGFKANVTARSRRRNSKRAQYFWSPGTNGLPRGVYRREGVTYQAPYQYRNLPAGRQIMPRGVAPVLLVFKSPTYGKRFDFPRLAGEESRRRFLDAWPRALERALRTARKRR